MEDLPPGFRFYPTEEELVSFYLHNKLEGKKHDALEQVIPVLSIYDFNPWDLPRLYSHLSLSLSHFPPFFVIVQYFRLAQLSLRETKL